jgi:hypothetical protein
MAKPPSGKFPDSEYIRFDPFEGDRDIRIDRRTLRNRIQELAKQHGSLRAAARVLDIDHAYLSRLQNGDKNQPGDDVLRKLKLRRVVLYMKTTKD